MVEWRTAGHAIAHIVAWQFRLATWASLRFDDCLHVDMVSFRLSESALYFTAQKTKRDQGRRGTKYVVCNALVTHAERLREGHECLIANASDTYLGSASDEQADDDEEKDDVYWATTKAMAALKPDKFEVHLTALTVPGDCRATCFPRTPVSRSEVAPPFSVTCVPGA